MQYFQSGLDFHADPCYVVKAKVNKCPETSVPKLLWHVPLFARTIRYQKVENDINTESL